jgi:4-amino-4-deoxy-L-arabinose transferase-like glycosyltransferase
MDATKSEASSSRDRWRWVPLASGVVVALGVPLTLGAAVLLVPISLALTVFAIRRTAGWSRDFVVGLGLLVNGLLAVIFAAAVAIIVYDELVG